jgi:hypothetical protein
LHERATRVIPGVLFFQGMGDNFYAQGGLQLSVPFNNAPTTFDSCLSLGVWLYRDGSLDVAARPTDPFERTALPFITGIMWQLEFLGKEVLNHSTDIPYQAATPGETAADFFTRSATGALVPIPYREGEHVYDMTIGIRFLFINHITWSNGYSFPLTGAYVRKSEFLSYLNVIF